MKKYDYATMLSHREYKRWEERMYHWTMFMDMWNRVATAYMREALKLDTWTYELHELTGLNDYD